MSTEQRQTIDTALRSRDVKNYLKTDCLSEQAKAKVQAEAHDPPTRTLSICLVFLGLSVACVSHFTKGSVHATHLNLSRNFMGTLHMGHNLLIEDQLLKQDSQPDAAQPPAPNLHRHNGVSSPGTSVYTRYQSLC